jgi:hypothetical protein
MRITPEEYSEIARAVCSHLIHLGIGGVQTKSSKAGQYIVASINSENSLIITISPPEPPKKENDDKPIRVSGPITGSTLQASITTEYLRAALLKQIPESGIGQDERGGEGDPPTTEGGRMGASVRKSYVSPPKSKTTRPKKDRKRRDEDYW